MVRFRVVRDASEAIWARPGFGMWLVFVGMVAAGCLLWWVPSPGIGVAVMGIAAALMAARKEPSGWEKAGWIFMMFALLLVEILAIRKDRREHDDQLAKILGEEVAARKESKSKFAEIGNGINDQSRLSERQFEKTVAQQSTQFLETMAGVDKSIEMQTGGNTVCYIDMLAQGRTGPREYGYLRKRGSNPLYGVTVHGSIALPLNEGAYQINQWNFSVGDLLKGADGAVIHKFPLPSSLDQDSVDLSFGFSARNGAWRQFIWLRKVNGKMLQASKIYRVGQLEFGKSPDVTPKRQFIWGRRDKEFPIKDGDLREDWSTSSIQQWLGPY